MARMGFQLLQELSLEGNFNTFVAVLGEYFGPKDLQTLWPEIKQYLLAGISEGQNKYCVSPATISTLIRLKKTFPTDKAFSNTLKSYCYHKSVPEVGRIPFPVVNNSRGIMRNLVVDADLASSITPTRQAQLELVGALMFSVVKKNNYRHLFWNPQDFYFSTLDHKGNNDFRVKGDSLGLPLLLSLYSRLTSIPVPVEISATGKIGTDGSVLPVSGIDKKLAVINVERCHIKKVMVSDLQDIVDPVPSGLELVRVKTVGEAIDEVFKLSSASFLPGVLFDSDKEVADLEHQKKQYQINSCIFNATEIINELKLPSCNLAKNKKIKNLFLSYGLRGSCYCHRGDIKKSSDDFLNASKLYRGNPGLIEAEKFLELKISQAVLLKDIFRYKEAVKVHEAVSAEIETIKALDFLKVQNISSLSQLYSAQGYFEEAEALQRQAIALVRRAKPEDLNRNYGYLVHLLTRKKDYPKAMRAAARMDEELAKLSESEQKSYPPFCHWYKAELLYRRLSSSSRTKKKDFKTLQQLACRYQEITFHAPALVRKFCALAHLYMGDKTGGMKNLNQVMAFFDNQVDPMYRLLGVTVRVELCLLHLLQERKPEIGHLKIILNDLQLQPNIARFFKNEVKLLEKIIANNKTFDQLPRLLSKLQNKIPY